MIEEVFPTTENQEELKQKVLDLENQISGLNPRNFAGIQDKELRAATRANIYGDGSDEDVVIDSNVTLTRDVFYNSLKVVNGFTLNTGGYRIFCIKDLINNGTISRDGSTGTAGGVPTGETTPGTGGAGGALAGGSLPGGTTGSAGGAGSIRNSANPANNPGSNGTVGVSVNKGLSVAGVGGGGGGRGGNGASVDGEAGGSGGNGGSITGTILNVPKSPQAAYALNDFNFNGFSTYSLPTTNTTLGEDVLIFGSTDSSSNFDFYINDVAVINSTGITTPLPFCFPIQAGNSFRSSTGVALSWIVYAGGFSIAGGAAGGGGGGGGGNTSAGLFNCGGGGGGGGSSGGVVSIFAGRIINNGTITAKGGAGGAGGNGGPGNGTRGSGGGGGGGGGGAGGVLVLCYGIKTGSGTYDVSGGVGGAGGTGGTGSGTETGITGTDGTAGLTGQIYEIVVG